MVISGTRVETFEEANFATLSVFKAEGEWRAASTNHSWECMWSEVVAYDGETVVLADLDGTLPIQEDERGEFVEVSQEHRSLLAGGDSTYPTRFRPYHEKSRTETKEWQKGEEDTNAC